MIAKDQFVNVMTDFDTLTNATVAACHLMPLSDQMLKQKQFAGQNDSCEPDMSLAAHTSSRKDLKQLRDELQTSIQELENKIGTLSPGNLVDNRTRMNRFWSVVPTHQTSLQVS